MPTVVFFKSVMGSLGFGVEADDSAIERITQHGSAIAFARLVRELRGPSYSSSVAIASFTRLVKFAAAIDSVSCMSASGDSSFLSASTSTASTLTFRVISSA
jgi:hypothetical protein